MTPFKGAGIVQSLGGMLGLNEQKVAAIRYGDDLYKKCCEPAELNKEFFIDGIQLCVLFSIAFTPAVCYSLRDARYIPNVVPGDTVAHVDVPRTAAQRERSR